jgi:hypothetical protein
MDDSFEEWVSISTQYPCFQKWADRLVELGASWDSFRRDRGEIVNDLVTGGIPLLAARDIVDIASAAVQRSTAPMAVFWDLENMPIPFAKSGRDVTSRLKSILAPHGDLVQFRGYASIGLGLIPQQKRSDLQLSGCHLVDCPHNGRKEVADKMIIVDAMQFAFLHPEGATLCFITGDVDYAYLLAVLQRPQWRTIVISKGTMQSMLHVNCDMKMRWETDILQLRYNGDSAVPLDTQAGSNDPAGDEEGKEGVTYRDVARNNPIAAPFEPLTVDEEREDDVALLRAIVRREGTNIDGLFPAALKSHIGNMLRHTNPARFPHREAIRSFFTEAIEMGAVVETGEGATKVLSLSTTNGGGRVGAIMSLSDQAPVSVKDIPERVLEMSIVMPFVLFAPWNRCPPGNEFPRKTFVHSYKEFAILMFHTLTDAQRSVAELTWLRVGTLVDWRRVEVGVSLGECSMCHDSRPVDEMVPGSSDKELYSCPECLRWSILNDDEKGQAVQRVLSVLQMMAANDDIYTAENILAKQLGIRHPDECTSRKAGALWIQAAVESGLVLSFKRQGVKAKLVCIPRQYENALAPFPPDTIETSKEESHVADILWHSKGTVSRVQVIESLKATFETMQTPVMRNKLFLNAQANGSFFVAKGPWLQTVGLTKEQALADLRISSEIPRGLPEDKAISDSFDTSNKDTTLDGDSLEDEAVSKASSIHDDDIEAILKNSFPADLSSSSNTVAASSRESMKNGTVTTLDSLAGPPLSPRYNTSVLAAGSVEEPVFNRLRDAKGNRATKNLYVFGYGPGVSPQQLRKLFSEHATLVDVFVKVSFSFVNTASREQAVLAREKLSGFVLNGGCLKINFAKE